MGNDRFEKKIMSKFDDFLHESFGEWMFAVRVMYGDVTPMFRSDGMHHSSPQDRIKGEHT